MRDIGSHAPRLKAMGRPKALPMSRIARGFPPTRPLARRIACAISMGHYQRSLVLAFGPAHGFPFASAAPGPDAGASLVRYSATATMRVYSGGQTPKDVAVYDAREIIRSSAQPSSCPRFGRVESGAWENLLSPALPWDGTNIEPAESRPVCPKLAGHWPFPALYRPKRNSAKVSTQRSFLLVGAPGIEPGTY